MIHTSLSPNTERDDLWLGLKTLLQPWKWTSGEQIEALEKSFAHDVGADHAKALQRGRDALLVLLQAMGIQKGDEVILQAYTCIVVPNAIRYAGATAVYADIQEKGFNIDPEDVKKKISKKTKAIIIQHTFGEAADIEAIQALCEEHNLLLIEDCAHALSGTWKDQSLGTFGDAAIWSFGRDKIISGVWGGMITTNSAVVIDKVKELCEPLTPPSRWQTFQSLLHPLVFAIAKPLYVSKIGKAILVGCQKLKLIPRVIFPLEKKGKKPAFFPQLMANANATLALHQLKKLPRFHRHRKQMATAYQEALKEVKDLQLPKPSKAMEPSWLRYTLRTERAQQLLQDAKKQGMYLGDWYTTVLAPADCALKPFGYTEGSCPRAEKAAKETINLPTHIQISPQQQKDIIAFVKRGAH